DYRASDKHSLFVRYSHDGNTNSGPFGIPVPPSNFVSNNNYVDQQLVGLTSVLSSTLVNDLRFSHMYWRNRNVPAGCEDNATGNVTWQKNTHQVKFGGTWEHFDGVGYWGFFDPARAYLLSPEFLAGVGVPPALFGLPDGRIHSLDDLKKLPVVTFLLGIGDRAQPSYHLDAARANDRFHLYVQDGWKVTPSFTLNYG